MRRNKTMTETRTQATPAVPVGQALGQVVGQAQSVLTRLLAGVLAETGAERQTYLALQRLSVYGDAAERDAYVHDLSDWLDLDLWAAGELATSLAASGLITLADGAIRLTDAGAELRESIRGSIGNITAPLWASLDAADLETTIRTLRDITVRARELPAVAGRGGADGGRS
jgi:hypothetical protein